MKPIYTVTLNPAFDLHYQMKHFEAQKENYVDSILCDAGGKGINISRALKVNGTDSTAFVILGEENGASFEGQLTRDGLNYRPIRTSGRIRENITLHPADSRETRISLDTFRVEPAVLEALERELLAVCRPGDLLAFAGRNPKGLDKEAVMAFLGRLIDGGVRMIVDSNSFAPEDLVKIHPWLIKPNEQEIVSFLGTPVESAEDAARAAGELVRRGVAEEVMISLGGDGAVWSDGKESLILSVPKLAHPVSTIGAGDSTLAGILHATARGADRETVLRTAVSFGTAACMTEGTLPPKPEDVCTVFARTRVK